MMKKKSLIIFVLVFISLVSLAASAAVAARFAISGTELELTVVDKATSLEWQQKSSSDSAVKWKDALAHCETLVFAGHNDWRLPSIVELMTIVDEKKETSPAINTVFFVDFLAHGYWTSTTARTTYSAAYVVYFNEFNTQVGRGGVDALLKTSSVQALCVRNAGQ